MTTGEMLGFTKRFNEIRKSNAPRHIKLQRIRNLMRDIDGAYQFDSFATRLYFTVASEL